MVGQGLFSLITGLAAEPIWKEAIAQLNLPFLRLVVIGSLDYQDPYCEWQRLREIEEDGALLVRPDGYIAWRQHSLNSYHVDTARTQLRAALQQVLLQEFS